uniref:Transposase (Putative), gypsy type n=1 Tax=Tanacetum cinerariifolium TaxID=118510 RepID=A0A699I3Y5_TANCI|nr:hypothetical protein [Tanacetum cinerariifolium]
MVRDTLQLEDSISQEYLLEFTSEYGIPESLHLELSGPEECIMEFSNGKVSVYIRFFEFANFHMDLFSLISTPNPSKVKTKTRPHATHKVSLLTATANRVIDMEDMVGASESFETPSTLEKGEGQDHDELAHRNSSAEDVTITKVMPEPSLEKEVAAMGSPVNKRRHKRGKEEAEANASPKVLRKDHATFHLSGERALRSRPEMLPLQRGYLSVGMGRNQQLPPGYPRGMPRHGRPHSSVEVTEKATTNIAKQDQKIQAREVEIKRLDQEIKSFRVAKAESNDLHNQTKNLKIVLEAEEDMKKAVEARNAKLAKELESLCIQFVDLQSSELRQSFAEVVSARLAKGMSKGLKYGIEHGRAGRDLADIEAYDPEDAPIDVIMASLYLESDSGEDAPQWIRELRPSSS